MYIYIYIIHFCLFTYLSIYLSTYLFISMLYVHIPTQMYMHMCMYIGTYVFVGMYESMLDSISAYEFNYAWCAPAIPVVHQSKQQNKKKKN